MYERDSRDVLNIQSEISQAIVKEVSAKLLPGEQARLAVNRRINPEAHEAYLKGSFLAERGSFTKLQTALDLFSKAIELDSDYAEAYFGYACVVATMGGDMTQPPEVAYERSNWAINMAIAKNPNLAEAHSMLARIKAYHDYDMKGGETEFRAAVDLNPGSAGTQSGYGSFLAATGRYDDALPYLQRAIDLNPLNQGARVYLAQTHLFYRHFDRATAILNDVLALDPENVPTPGIFVQRVVHVPYGEPVVT